MDHKLLNVGSISWHQLNTSTRIHPDMRLRDVASLQKAIHEAVSFTAQPLFSQARKGKFIPQMRQNAREMHESFKLSYLLIHDIAG